MFYYYVGYMVFMNILSFILFAADKKRAIERRWRIPEIVLLGTSLLGGCIGGFIAMRLFHHKTLHLIFSLGLPIMILAHGCLLIYLFEHGYMSLPW